MKASGRMRLCHYTLDGRVRSADFAVRRPDPRGGGRVHTSQLGVIHGRENLSNAETSWVMGDTPLGRIFCHSSARRHAVRWRYWESTLCRGNLVKDHLAKQQSVSSPRAALRFLGLRPLKGCKSLDLSSV